jgi:UDP-sugar transporter A1/2/3
MSSTSSNVFFKLLLLSLLALQNSGHTLTMRYSRGVLKERYLITSTVILGEIIKLLICLVVLLKQNHYNVVKTLDRLVYVVKHSLVMSVPGLLYLIQNKLQFVGLQNLESSSYAILSQLKLLTTAVFSVLLLRKHLYAYQWRALLLLFIGVLLVQSREVKDSGASNSEANPGLGTLAVLGVTGISGIAGVWFELHLKGSTQFTLWDRNVQLSIWFH